ncbi:zinc-ribbon domain-containing protein [Ktedonospora formicarum]|uniref:zinc-ribbon domain-containing protein n=1 Tax=Ktedonospora formicarum TaxID=2778364 RepID=UPI003B75CFB7
MIRCTNCGTDNPVSSAFCGYCGRTMQQEGVNDLTRQNNQTLLSERNAPTHLSGPHSPVTPPPIQSLHYPSLILVSSTIPRCQPHPAHAKRRKSVAGARPC